MDKAIKKQLITPANAGGAPLYVEDMVRIQEHAQSLSLPMLQRSAEIAGTTVRVLGNASSTLGATKAGFYITPPSFQLSSDNGSGAEIVVSEFTAYIDGKVCAYNGGTLDFISLLAAGYDGYFVEVGNEIKETRVFRDGVNRELFVTNEVKLTRIPFSNVYGLGLGASYLDAPGVLLAAAFNDTITDVNNSRYPLKHPNCAWDTLGLSGIIEKSLNSVSKSEANVSSWVSVTMSDGTDYIVGNSDVQVREESLSESLRMRGSATYTVTSSNESLIGSLPFTRKPSFEQVVLCTFTNTNEMGFIRFKSNGEIWAKTNLSGGQNTATILFDGVTIVGS